MFKEKKLSFIISLIAVLLLVTPLSFANAQNISPDYIEYDYQTKTVKVIPYETVITSLENFSDSLIEESKSGVRFTPEYTPPELDQVNQN